MHEISLVSGILKVLQDKVKEFNFQRVLQVNLTVGEMTNVEEGTLTAAFEVCTEGTVFSAAKLAFERVPVRGKCRRCEAEFTVCNYHFQCPQCGGQTIDIIAGKEFFIKSIEVE